MGILFAVVIAHYMLNRIHDETQEFIRLEHSHPAMFSTLPAPALVIAHSYCTEFVLKHKSLSVNIIAILPCTALYLHPQWSFHIAYCTDFALKHKILTINIKAILPCRALYLHP